MATTIAEAEEAHIGLLGEVTFRENYKKLFFSRFMGFVQESDQPGERFRVPATPIVMRRQFGTEGMTKMTIPMRRRLVGLPVYGNDTLVGKGEAQRLNYQLLRINMRRKGVQPPTVMDVQRVKRLQMVEMAQPQLAEWMPYDTERQILTAVYEGYSDNVTAALASFGYAQTKYQHPNIFAADTGKITWSATDATYKTNIHNAVSGFTGAAAELMSARLLRDIASEAYKLDIEPVMINGKACWPMLMHPNQKRQLAADEEFQQAMRHAGPRDLLENPIFRGINPEFYYEGILGFTRQFSVWGVATTSAPTVTWGTSNPISAVDTEDRKGAILFGKQFLVGGHAFGPDFTTEMLDHGHWKEVGVRVVDGFARVKELLPLYRVNGIEKPCEFTGNLSAADNYRYAKVA